MEATVIKSKGLLQDSKVMMGGITLLNPYRTPYATQVFSVFTRVPNLVSNAKNVRLKAYDGIIGSTSSDFPLISTEIIGNSVVRTYEIALSSGSNVYTDDLGNQYIGRQVRMRNSEQVPWRIDIIGDDLDFSQAGEQSSGYDDPISVDAEQIKYSTIPYSGKRLVVTRCTGAIKTEWFRNNPNLYRLDVKSKYATIQGNILDLATTAKTLGYFNFTSQVGIKGVMSEFLDACSAFGAKSRTIEVHITESGIINDVYPGPSGDYTYQVFDAVFDANGDWTTQAT